MAAADVLRITVRGRGGHGGQPHETIDAIAVTGQVLTALQTIISRNVNPQDTAVLSIGMVRGGTAFNVIAETVELLGTLRTFQPTVRETVLTRLRVLTVEPLTGPVINDPVAAETARQAAHQVVGSTALYWQAPLMVSEDFAEYARLAPSCFMLLGSANTELGLDAAHHNPRFDFDEQVLPIGAALLATAATRWLAERTTT